MPKRLSILLVLLTSAAAMGQAASQPSQTPPSTQPASAPVATQPVADLLKDCIDPYNSGVERERFFAAAGADGELDAAKFAANAGKKNAFVRPFDTWEAMLAFDKNGNKTIDWFEAEAYRLDLRKRVLEAFDADKDGKLTGPERDAANRALAAGQITPLKAAASQPSSRPGRGMSDDEDLTPEQRKARREEDRKRAEELRRQWELKHFDAQGKGELTEQEKVTAKAFEEGLQKVGEELGKQIMNPEGGDPKEQQAAARTAGLKVFAKIVSEMNDGNPTPNPQVLRGLQQRVQQGFEKWIERAISRHDPDADGIITAEKSKVIIDGIRQDLQEKFKSFDANNDGKLDADEMQSLMEDMARELGLLRKAATTAPAPAPSPK